MLFFFGGRLKPMLSVGDGDGPFAEGPFAEGPFAEGPFAEGPLEAPVPFVPRPLATTGGGATAGFPNISVLLSLV